MLDFSIKLVAGPRELSALTARLESAPALALDIETVDWWDRRVERVALIQLAFREGQRVRVAVVDALAGLDLESLRPPLESETVTKAIHNAAYDAPRLLRHFSIRASPIHDTMLAARRGGERRCSLQAQAEAHFGLRLDKGEQRGDWGRRPLTLKQLRYAALDAACTLLLYEEQSAKGLSAGYQLREEARSRQAALPLGDDPRPTPGVVEEPGAARASEPTAEGLRAPAIALLGVVTELAGRYSPDRLAVSAGSERVGLAGWIIDRTLGAEADLDEETARVEIAELCERGLVMLDAGRRLEATESGAPLAAVKAGLSLKILISRRGTRPKFSSAPFRLTWIEVNGRGEAARVSRDARAASLISQGSHPTGWGDSTPYAPQVNSILPAAAREGWGVETATPGTGLLVTSVQESPPQSRRASRLIGRRVNRPMLVDTFCPRRFGRRPVRRRAARCHRPHAVHRSPWRLQTAGLTAVSNRAA